MGPIMVLAEHRQGQLRDITFEILKKAQDLSEALGHEVHAVLIGEGLLEMAERLRPFCHKIHFVPVEGVREFEGEVYQAVLARLIKDLTPSLVLIGHTAQGMDLAPALACAFNSPLISDCYDFGFREGRFWAFRQVYGGKLSAQVEAEGSPVIVTVRSGSFEAEELKALGGQVVSWEGSAGFFPYKRFLRFIEAPRAEVDISQAEVIVSVGRGIGGPENIPLAEELAKALGGVLACSRPVVDKGWLPKERQVGTSGKTVKPKVYIALGISGAFQHVAGMKQSGLIIAVNKDPKAPIFNVAHYGIVGDLLQVIPVLLSKLKERKK